MAAPAQPILASTLLPPSRLFKSRSPHISTYPTYPPQHPTPQQHPPAPAEATDTGPAGIATQTAEETTHTPERCPTGWKNLDDEVLGGGFECGRGGVVGVAVGEGGWGGEVSLLCVLCVLLFGLCAVVVL